jgi:hypothetical protein
MIRTMADPQTNKRRIRWAIVAAVVVVFLLAHVENWGRDFVGWKASLSDRSPDPSLRSLTVGRPVDQMVAATRMAARRIGNWRYVGDAVDGDTTLMYFVRTNRLLRLKDDVTVRLTPGGRGTIVRGESVARLHVGDLGRNPRNLRRFVTELKVVLDNSVPAAVISSKGMPRR